MKLNKTQKEIHLKFRCVNIDIFNIVTNVNVFHSRTRQFFSFAVDFLVVLKFGKYMRPINFDQFSPQFTILKLLNN